MEWQINKEVPVARNVFELAVTKFGNESGFFVEYLKFLNHLNEENSTKKKKSQKCKFVANFFFF